jgi:hypothetical protein
VSAPQTLTVTVTKSGKGSGFAPGQVVTVSIGSTGQMVRVNAEGCGTGSSLTAKEAELHAVATAGGHDPSGRTGESDHQSTTDSTTTTTQSTATTQ